MKFKNHTFKNHMAISLLVLAGACAGTGVAQAHNIWLLPSSTVLSKAEWITVDAAVSNDLFFFNHVPLQLERLHVSGPHGASVVVQNPHTGKLRSVFDLHLEHSGSYRVAVVNNGLFASYKDPVSGQARRWRGSVEKLATEIPANAQELKITQALGRVETFVTVGKPSTLQPSGQGLELQPVTHPNDLVQGEKATFTLHVDGQPAAGLEVNVVAGASRYRNQLSPTKIVTDAQGQFSITWPQAGMYWLEAESKDHKTTIPQAQERRLSYVVTLEVLP